MDAIGNGIAQAAWHLAWSRVAIAAMDAALCVLALAVLWFALRNTFRWIGSGEKATRK